MENECKDDLMTFLNTDVNDNMQITDTNYIKCKQLVMRIMGFGCMNKGYADFASLYNENKEQIHAKLDILSNIARKHEKMLDNQKYVYEHEIRGGSRRHRASKHSKKHRKSRKSKKTKSRRH